MNQEKYDDLLLDKFDISLLAALQKDAHATNQQVGEQIHLSASQVSRRIQRLETSGIIRRYVALLDPAALGLGVRAMSYVTLSRHGGDEGEVRPGRRHPRERAGHPLRPLPRGAGLLLGGR